MKKDLTICFFGVYNPNYSRNQVLIRGFKENGVNVIECQSNQPGFKKYFEIIKKHKRVKGKYDVMLVAFPGHLVMFLAKILCRKKIIFDVFVSLYDSVVLDRKAVDPKSIKAKWFWFLDWFSALMADVLLIDTNAHIDYFYNKYKIQKNKFIRVWVGTDDEIMKPIPSKQKNKKLSVCFYGSGQWLQGFTYLGEAAELLKNENIEFNIIGTRLIGHLKKYESKKFVLHENVDYSVLADYIAKSDISLGIFGDTKKALRVIPNKVYDALASRVALISGESPAMCELFKDKENVLFCRLADARDLADKIMELKNNQELREKIGSNGYQLFLNKLTPKIICQGLLHNLKQKNAIKSKIII